jgi:hypothetical protein
MTAHIRLSFILTLGLVAPAGAATRLMLPATP